MSLNAMILIKLIPNEYELAKLMTSAFLNKNAKQANAWRLRHPSMLIADH